MSSAQEYQVYLRDPERAPQLLADDFTSFTMVPTYNNVAKWMLDLPMTSAALGVLEPGWGIIVEQDEVPILSGNADDLSDDFTDDGRQVMKLRGVDDTATIANLQALPCAPTGTSGQIYPTSAYDTEAADGETVMRNYVNNNAITSDYVPGLVLGSNLNRGGYVSEAARFGTLLGLLQSTAIHAGGLGFRVVQNQGSTELVFQVYEPVDRSADVIFSREQGNLEKYTFQTQAPTCNHVIVAGGGEGTDRIFVEIADVESIIKWGRRMQFVDQRQTVDIDELTQAANEALEKGQEKRSLSVNPIDPRRDYAVPATPTDGSMPVYGSGYQVGDIVRVDVEGVPVIDVIQQATITIKPDEGLIVRPTVGTTGATNPKIPDFFRRTKQLDARLVSLETT